jgi:hypothetical protein
MEAEDCFPQSIPRDGRSLGCHCDDLLARTLIVDQLALSVQVVLLCRAFTECPD